MPELSNIGHRQKELLEALLHNRKGLTVEQLVAKLSISRNAVSQHIASLEAAKYIEKAILPSTGGRPSKIYSLSGKGLELFPRQYALMSTLLLQLVQDKLGLDSLKHCLVDLGEQLAQTLKSRVLSKPDFEAKVAEATVIMHELGYETLTEHAGKKQEIVASNCVFHKLAEENHDICDLDTSLISSLLDVHVEHQECMVKGGQYCRFKLAEKKSKDLL